jgi:hypothetical protein
MKSFNIKPNIDFLNFLIKRRLVNQNYTHADVAFKLIQENQLTPNEMTFGCLAYSVINVKTFEEFIKDLKAIGYALNNHMISTIYRKTCHTLNIGLAKKLLDCIIEDNVRVNQIFMDKISNNIAAVKDRIIEFVSLSLI